MSEARTIESRGGSWTRLAELSSEAEAQLIQGYLATADIPCQVESLAFRAEPVTFGPLARVRLWVLRRHLEQARRLLQQVQDEAIEAAEEQATVDDAFESTHGDRH